MLGAVLITLFVTLFFSCLGKASGIATFLVPDLTVGLLTEAGSVAIDFADFAMPLPAVLDFAVCVPGLGLVGLGDERGEEKFSLSPKRFKSKRLLIVVGGT